MKDVGGTKLPGFPIGGLKHVRDLLYFDGPLLSEYVHDNGDRYLYYWCDCDKVANRWMVLRVSEASILRLVNRFVPMAYVIPDGCRDDFVYIVDICDDGSRTAHMLPKSAIPDDYKPDHGAYLIGHTQSVANKAYSLLVENEWSIPDLGRFPNVFTKLYSFIYGMKELHVPGLRSFPWRGGFSSLHFFNWMENQIPFEDKVQLSAIQYASPGFVRFKLKIDTAEEVSRCVERYIANNEEISKKFADLTCYVRDNKLNVEEYDKAPDWSKHDDELKTKAKALMDVYGCINSDDFLKVCSRPFEAAKIAMAFHRNIRELYHYEKKGMVRFPRMET